MSRAILMIRAFDQDFHRKNNYKILCITHEKLHQYSVLVMCRYPYLEKLMFHELNCLNRY